MKKRMKYAGFLVAAVLVLCLTATTTAFLTRQVVTDNLLTFGNLSLALRQTTLTAQGEEVPITQDTPFRITSHQAVSRILRVENTGNHPMYVRVSLQVVGVASDGQAIDVQELVSFQLNKSDWVYQDGWYYYTQALPPHAITQELMTQVIFHDIDAVTQQYPGCQFDLDVDAQAVQSENNASHVLSATGWPES